MGESRASHPRSLHGQPAGEGVFRDRPARKGGESGKLMPWAGEEGNRWLRHEKWYAAGPGEKKRVKRAPLASEVKRPSAGTNPSGGKKLRDNTSWARKTRISLVHHPDRRTFVKREPDSKTFILSVCPLQILVSWGLNRRLRILAGLLRLKKKRNIHVNVGRPNLLHERVRGHFRRIAIKMTPPLRGGEGGPFTTATCTSEIVRTASKNSMRPRKPLRQDQLLSSRRRRHVAGGKITGVK